MSTKEYITVKKYLVNFVKRGFLANIIWKSTNVLIPGKNLLFVDVAVKPSPENQHWLCIKGDTSAGSLGLSKMYIPLTKIIKKAIFKVTSKQSDN